VLADKRDGRFALPPAAPRKLARLRRASALALLCVAIALASVALLSPSGAAAGSRLATTDSTSLIGPTGPTASNCTVNSGTLEPGAGTTGTGETPAPLGPAPTGLIAVKIYSPKAKVQFPSALFTPADSYIKGLDFLAQWCNLEPHPDLFNWAPLDTVFQQAQASGKFVILTLIPGFETPSWALSGVQGFTSSFSYNTADDTNAADARVLPLPWDPTYLGRWFTFLRAVADRYGDDKSFRVIEAAGPTSVSTEMTLPDLTGSQRIAGYPEIADGGLPASYGGKALDGSDIAAWEAAGYTPAKLVGAWTQAFAAYHQIFRNQFMALALFPSLPIGDDSTVNVSEGSQARLDVVSLGKTNYQPSFIVQEDGLAGTGTGTDPGYNIVRANCTTVVTGLQTKVPPNDLPLTPALALGVRANLNFIEVYAGDVVSMPSVFTSFEMPSSPLPATDHCAPLRLTSSAGTSAPAGAPATVTATTDLTLPPGRIQVVNVFEQTAAGPVLVRECTTSSCPVPITPGVVATRFTADVGAPGTAPYTSQALVSAALTAGTSGSNPKPIAPNCKGTACL
jgi:hypothetical protein